MLAKGRRPGDHNFFAAVARPYDAQSREWYAISPMRSILDTATNAWEAAFASSWDRPAVWVHGDVAPSNLLVMKGSSPR